jgi:hypothetical protein
MLYSKCNTSLVASLNLSPICCQKVFFLLNADFAMEVLDLISLVHLVSSVIGDKLSNYDITLSLQLVYFFSVRLPACLSVCL